MRPMSRRQFAGLAAGAVAGAGLARPRRTARPHLPPAAAFPSVLTCVGRTLQDSSGATMPLLPGFNVQPVPWPASAFSDMYGKGARLIRTVVFWDLMEPTKGNISSSYIANLDTHIQRCVAAGIYTTINFYFGPNGNHMPSWAETTGGPASSMGNYIANGQNSTTYLAKRYGDPSDPLGAGQYTKAVIGFGVNEPTPDTTTGNTWETDLFSQQATMGGWFRTYAADWIIIAATAWAASAVIPNATGSGQTTQTFTGVSHTPFSAQGGNWMLDIHDYFKCLTTPSKPNFDGRNTTTGAAETVANGGTQIQEDSAGYPNYPPSVSGLTRTICQEQQTAELANYVDYCSAADVPLFIGEQGWNATFNDGGQFNNGNGPNFIADKIAAWKAVTPVGICYWDYNTDQGSDAFAADPGTGAKDVNSDGWLTVVDTFMGTTWPTP